MLECLVAGQALGRVESVSCGRCGVRGVRAQLAGAAQKKAFGRTGGICDNWDCRSVCRMLDATQWQMAKENCWCKKLMGSTERSSFEGV